MFRLHIKKKSFTRTLNINYHLLVQTYMFFYRFMSIHSYNNIIIIIVIMLVNYQTSFKPFIKFINYL